VVFSLAAFELGLIKTFTTIIGDTSPEFVLRANCYLVGAFSFDIFAILREPAIQGVAVAFDPTSGELCFL
jgi:hypothetical protein